MKKLITLVVALTLLMGCSSSDSDSTSDSIVYDIEMTVKIGDVERKYVDVYSYNNYSLSEFSFNPPVIYSSGSEFDLSNGYLYGMGANGILTGSIGDLSLELGPNIASGQIITYAANSGDGSNGPFSFDFGGWDSYGYYFNDLYSYGQIKITSNQNNKLAGEFTFNNITVYSSTGTNEFATVTGKFKNMPIE